VIGGWIFTQVGDCAYEYVFLYSLAAATDWGGAAGVGGAHFVFWGGRVRGKKVASRRAEEDNAGDRGRERRRTWRE